MAETRLNERWKVIEANPAYQVSDHGSVRGARGAILRPGRTKSGHLTVYIAGVGSAYVHVLVAEAFVGPKPSAKHEVRHEDGDPGNNFWGNLFWSTRGRNNQDKKHHAGAKGRLKINQVREIKARLLNGERGVDLAREFGVGQTAISAIKHGHNHPEVQL